jgi:hypothetical protein
MNRGLTRQLLLPAIFVSILLAVSCGKKQEVLTPENVYSTDSMVSIMADIHIAESLLQNYGYQTDHLRFKSAYLQQLIHSANIDTARFNRSFDFYAEQPELFARIYDKVIAEISNRQAQNRAKE